MIYINSLIKSIFCIQQQFFIITSIRIKYFLKKSPRVDLVRINVRLFPVEPYLFLYSSSLGFAPPAS